MLPPRIKPVEPGARVQLAVSDEAHVARGGVAGGRIAARRRQRGGGGVAREGAERHANDEPRPGKKRAVAFVLGRVYFERGKLEESSHALAKRRIGRCSGPWAGTELGGGAGFLSLLS